MLLPTEAEWEKAAKGGCGIWGDSAQYDDGDTLYTSYPYDPDDGREDPPMFYNEP